MNTTSWPSRIASELMSRAAECFPGFRWQHWDVGLSAGGPVLFELNSAGNTRVLQVSHGTGIWCDRLRAFLARYGGKTEPTHGSVFLMLLSLALLILVLGQGGNSPEMIIASNISFSILGR